MDPIDLAKKLFLATFTLAQTLGNGSLGDSYSLSLHSWQNSFTTLRGEFHTSRRQKFEAPSYAIFSASRGNFLNEEEYGIADPDGTVEITWKESSDLPFTITGASRENWNCSVPGANGPLALISKVSDFRLLLVATIPKASPMLSTLGGWSRTHIRFPGSRPALSPCNSTPDWSGQNVSGRTPDGIARTESVMLQPAVMKGTTVIPLSARAIIQPARVNWIYWDAQLGFGPLIVFEGYGAAPGPQE